MLFRCIETNVPANTRKCGLDTPQEGHLGLLDHRHLETVR